jgi:S-adenosylmethionine decarboxylase
MQGLHLTADLSDCQCDPRGLTDAVLLIGFCVQAVQRSGLQAVSQLAYTFPASGQGPGGVTATVLLAESHLCVHTWPEIAAVTVDVYVCNYGADHSAKAQALMDALVAHFAPSHSDRQILHRGRPNSLSNQ